MSDPYELETYEPDDRGDTYRMVGDLLGHVATRCGVTADATTVERWRDAMGVMREIDTLADEDCNTRDDAYGILRDYTFFEPRYPALAPDNLGYKKFNQMLGHVKTIMRLGDNIAEETDIGRFIEMRKLEAYHTVRALGAAASPEVQQQAGFATCMWRFTGLGIGATMADSILDARTDYARGKTQLEPHASFYRQAGAQIVRHALPHAHTILDSEAISIRANILKHRVTHRLTHGIPRYSNLRLIEALWRRQPK